MKTYFYNTKLSATTDQKTLELPSLRNITITNEGDNDIYYQLDNDIDANSPKLFVQQSVTLKARYIKLNYKALLGTATVAVSGERDEKE